MMHAVVGAVLGGKKGHAAYVQALKELEDG